MAGDRAAIAVTVDNLGDGFCSVLRNGWLAYGRLPTPLSLERAIRGIFVQFELFVADAELAGAGPAYSAEQQLAFMH